MMKKTMYAGPHTATPSLLNKDAGGEAWTSLAHETLDSIDEVW
jgi:hypothetical protein